MSASEAIEHKVLLIVVIVLSPIIILLAGTVLFCWVVASTVVVMAVSLVWCTRGVSFLIVYSDSAQWKEYFEDEVIPVFANRARVLNLSTDGGRKKWWHLDWWIYRHCAGYRNRFPIVIRFSPLGRWRAIRFYDAFIQAKKGKVHSLEECKTLVGIWSLKKS